AGVSNTFTQTENDEYRGDREMTICAMQAVVGRARTDMQRVERDGVNAVSAELRRLLKLVPLPPATVDTTPPPPSLYCRVAGVLKGLIKPTPAQAQDVRQAPRR